MKKLAVFFLSLIAFLLSLPLPVFAQENFSVASTVTYSVFENGTTHVSFSSVLTNQASEYSALSYKIRVGFNDIKNLEASDSNGKINPEIIKDNNEATIKLPFKKAVTGKSSSISLSFSFDTEDVASKQGKIWEINIPGLSSRNEFSGFDVIVKVPSSFGEPVYVKPSLGVLIKPDGSLYFPKDTLKKSGISIAYGKNQVYYFNLDYHIKNSNLFPIKKEIALPPSTNYQEVFIESIDPKPLKIITDKDGNSLAQFYLLPFEKKDISVMGNAKIFLNPKKQSLSDSQKREYLKELPYWETQNESIKKLANTLKTPKAIYDYVVTTLTYDYSRVAGKKPRLGAAQALQTPSSAVCLEFNDLFIAFARAASIPAREVDGFAFSNSSKQRPLSLVSDVLHAWPEYYDDKLNTWVMVDPTWENTTGGVDYFHTFDFDHFAFIIKGLNSSYPIPPGGNKDIQISFNKEKLALTNKDNATKIQANGLLIAVIFIIAAGTGSILFFRQKG
ncbi:MAG: transglutaminase domain-containing protein [bacterium]|nr:transglutaminase domain-containing protein [bacterium]